MAGFLAKAVQYIKAVKRGVTVPVEKAELHAGETIQADIFASPGNDSPPLPDDMLFLVKNSATGGYVCVGIVDQVNDPEAEPGERRLYSRDSDGNVKAVLFLKGDGILEVNGNADYAVAFDDLKIAFDQLKSDFDAHTHVYNPGPLTPASTAVTTPSTADIDPAKVPTVKLP